MAFTVFAKEALCYLLRAPVCQEHLCLILSILAWAQIVHPEKIVSGKGQCLQAGSLPWARLLGKLYFLTSSRASNSCDASIGAVITHHTAHTCPEPNIKSSWCPPGGPGHPQKPLDHLFPARAGSHGASPEVSLKENGRSWSALSPLDCQWLRC